MSKYGIPNKISLPFLHQKKFPNLLRIPDFPGTQQLCFTYRNEPKNARQGLLFEKNVLSRLCRKTVSCYRLRELTGESPELSES